MYLQRVTFTEVKAPFAGHLAASSAWPPAATPSPRGGRESRCSREKQMFTDGVTSQSPLDTQMESKAQRRYNSQPITLMKAF